MAAIMNSSDLEEEDSPDDELLPITPSPNCLPDAVNLVRTTPAVLSTLREREMTPSALRAPTLQALYESREPVCLIPLRLNPSA